jgi:hypothetical protein
MHAPVHEHVPYSHGQQRDNRGGQPWRDAELCQADHDRGEQDEEPGVHERSAGGGRSDVSTGTPRLDRHLRRRELDFLPDQLSGLARQLRHEVREGPVVLGRH